MGCSKMASEKRLIEELREMADRTPPICHYDKPYNTEIFGKQITVYCKPFEQFQELLRRAADALSVDAIPVEELEQLLAVTPGLELWDYQKRAIMNAVHRMLGKERQ